MIHRKYEFYKNYKLKIIIFAHYNRAHMFYEYIFMF